MCKAGYNKIFHKWSSQLIENIKKFGTNNGKHHFTEENLKTIKDKKPSFAPSGILKSIKK